MADGACRFLFRSHMNRSLGSLFTVRHTICSFLNRSNVRKFNGFSAVDSLPLACCTTTRKYFRRQPTKFCSRFLFMRYLGTTQGKMTGPKSEFILGYEDIPELETAPENVKRIFRLSNANQFEQRKVAKEELKESFGGKKKEQHIAELTLKINTLIKHCEEKPKDKHNKVFLQWLVDQRKKKLKALKASQFEHYLGLIKKLDIPPLESPHSKWNKYKFRKFKLGVNIEKKQSFLERKMIK